MVTFVYARLSVRCRRRLRRFVVVVVLVAAFHPKRQSLFSERILSAATVASLFSDARPHTHLCTLTSPSPSRRLLFPAAVYFYRFCYFLFASPVTATNRALAYPATLLGVDSTLSAATAAT